MSNPTPDTDKLQASIERTMRLRKAAPDMLAALHRTLSYLQDIDDADLAMDEEEETRRYTEVFDAVTAAIAKATGEA